MAMKGVLGHVKDNRPAIVLNLKAYERSSGEGGLALCLAAETVASRHHDVHIIICPQVNQLYLLGHKLKHASVFAQAADSNPPGKFTGTLTVNAIADSGCAGTLMNHAERQASMADIGQVLEHCKPLGLKVVACANNVAKARQIAELKPWAVAVEVPELIGTGRSVSTVEPEVVTDAVSQIGKANPDVRVFVGAGVSTGEDVLRSLELGTSGVVLSSRYVDAPDPQKLLEQMAAACK